MSAAHTITPTLRSQQHPITLQTRSQNPLGTTPAHPRVAIGRAAAERITARAEHLPPAQRALIEQVFVLGQPTRAIAALTGRSPRAVRRSVSRITKRTATAEFALVASRAGDWSPALSVIAHDLFIAGLSLRACAATRGVSLHAVRGARSLVIALAQHAQARAGSTLRLGHSPTHHSHSARSAHAPRATRAITGDAA